MQVERLPEGVTLQSLEQVREQAGGPPGGARCARA